MTFGEWIEKETEWREHYYIACGMSIGQLYEIIQDLIFEKMDLAQNMPTAKLGKYDLLIDVYLSELSSRTSLTDRDYSNLYH